MSNGPEPLYRRLLSSILMADPDHAEHDVKPSRGLSAVEKLSIYINAYRLRLRSAIEADYPGLTAYLASETFSSLVEGYIETHPSSSYNLNDYTGGFGAYVRTFSQDAFASDLAELEATIMLVFYGPESDPLDVTLLQNSSIDEFAAIQLNPRASSRLVAFHYPVNEWLEAERRKEKPTIPGYFPSFLYIYRHKNEVQRVALSEPAFLFLKHLFASPSVGQAFDDVMTQYPGYNEILSNEIMTWFSEWTAKGFFNSKTKS